ncbi:heparan sulfate glucosamine 3-O-sulfotransferase 5 [Platysternon megacephalum]|uniref:Heparan sulfate glucosamine 3-O-sulfotransferase 5 n=1 Tax=Platysternon megacephalum TaxID=55544 RepID=A0A4D9DH37_9SAUR|nr:heparan sulfate glucosamine 3-O-sulfotransferase 5 [Platysternon megacephalum]
MLCNLIRDAPTPKTAQRALGWGRPGAAGYISSFSSWGEGPLGDGGVLPACAHWLGRAVLQEAGVGSHFPRAWKGEPRGSTGDGSLMVPEWAIHTGRDQPGEGEAPAPKGGSSPQAYMGGLGPSGR